MRHILCIKHCLAHSTFLCDADHRRRPGRPVSERWTERRPPVHHILIALLFVAGAIVMAANGAHQLY